MADQIVERVVELINGTILATNEREKLDNLVQVQELVIHHDILDNFLDEVLSFQNNPSPTIRKFVLGFIEACCLKNAEFLPKLILNINLALGDEHAHVLKKAVQIATTIYRAYIKSIINKIDAVVESTLEAWWQIKQIIYKLLDTSDNDGVKTQCIKFMESIVITQTKPDQWSQSSDNGFTIEQLVENRFITVEQYEEEAKQVFEHLLIFHATPHISSINLIVTMQTLVIIARQRSMLFMSKVIQALESLHANLPPTLAKSQVTSVRKQLKVQLTLLLKHPLAAMTAQYQSQIVQLLNDLGTGQQEVYKCLQEVRKRGLVVEQASMIEPKRFKADPDESGKDDVAKVTRSDANTAIDITAEDLVPKIENIDNVCNLVAFSMLSLPDVMPPYFQATYTPVAFAGTPQQIKHLARLLATQLTASGLGKGVEEMVNRATSKSKQTEDQRNQQHQKIATLISRGIAHEIKKQEQANQSSRDRVTLMPSGRAMPASGALKLRQLNLNEITRELPRDVKERVVTDAVNRILLKEEKSLFFSQSQIETRYKILSHLCTEFHGDDGSNCDVSRLIRQHAFGDLRNRVDLLFSAISAEFTSATKKGPEQANLKYYTNFLRIILFELIENFDQRDREHFMPRFFIEAPLINQELIDVLGNFILSDRGPANTDLGFSILTSLITKNTSQMRPQLLSLLLKLTIHLEKSDVRSNAIKAVKTLYGADFKGAIEKFALDMVGKLLDAQCEFAPGKSQPWTEESIKIYLQPYLNLLPSNPKLIHDLAVIYVSTAADIKRVILRMLDSPVKGIGMASPELLALVETCPKGAETLVMRVIHLLTEKEPPSVELVQKVRELYQKRVPDVRFLIPVLNGLTKKEVIDALPKLIKLSPNVVKEVFNRLLGTHADSSSNYQSPLTSADLLIALHNIDTTKCDMKTIIKAIGLCFAERNIYTAEVLAVVIQFLLEQNPLPTLLMRTVIQSLSIHNRLIGFVMNILHRLILKQVWKQKKVWEGFIKCCQQTKPQSFQVLLQLPPAQLQSVFLSCGDFKPALRTHIESLPESERSHIRQPLLDVIFGDDEEPKEIKNTEIQPSDVEMKEPIESIDVLIIKEEKTELPRTSVVSTAEPVSG